MWRSAFLLFIFLGCRRQAVDVGSQTNTNTDSYGYPFKTERPTCDAAGNGVGAFNARRDNGTRKHAGCDLYYATGQPIYAIADGIVVDLHDFYLGTDALEVSHNGNTFVYGEIQPNSATAKIGDKVTKGQLIAKVGRLKGIDQAMLHFEQYNGTDLGVLGGSAYCNKKYAGGVYCRKYRPQDPTNLLESALKLLSN